MLRLLLNSEATNTKGAIKPCQSPSQKHATSLCSFAVPLYWLGPAAHPARMFINSRRSTSKARENFMAIPPLPMVTKQGYEKSQDERQRAATPLPQPCNQRSQFKWAVCALTRTLGET